MELEKIKRRVAIEVAHVKIKWYLAFAATIQNEKRLLKSC